MRKRVLIGLCLALAAPAVRAAQLPIGPAADEGPTCNDLWLQRNAIFKDAGYCFHTQRGIKTFGNAGCSYDSEAEVPLSALQRDRISQIRRAERVQGCAP